VTAANRYITDHEFLLACDMTKGQYIVTSRSTQRSEQETNKTVSVVTLMGQYKTDCPVVANVSTDVIHGEVSQVCHINGGGLRNSTLYCISRRANYLSETDFTPSTQFWRYSIWVYNSKHNTESYYNFPRNMTLTFWLTVNKTEEKPKH
jgi:hypothetical protein